MKIAILYNMVHKLNIIFIMTIKLSNNGIQINKGLYVKIEIIMITIIY